MGTLLRWLEDDILHSVDLPRKKPPFSRMNVVGINQDHKDLDFKGILFCPFDSVFVCGSQAHRHIAKATQHPYMHIDYACLHSMCTHRPKMYRSLILVG